MDYDHDGRSDLVFWNEDQKPWRRTLDRAEGNLPGDLARVHIHGDQPGRVEAQCLARAWHAAHPRAPY